MPPVRIYFGFPLLSHPKTPINKHHTKKVRALLENISTMLSQAMQCTNTVDDSFCLPSNAFQSEEHTNSYTFVLHFCSELFCLMSELADLCMCIWTDVSEYTSPCQLDPINPTNHVRVMFVRQSKRYCMEMLSWEGCVYIFEKCFQGKIKARSV